MGLISWYMVVCLVGWWVGGWGVGWLGGLVGGLAVTCVVGL